MEKIEKVSAKMPARQPAAGTEPGSQSRVPFRSTGAAWLRWGGARQPLAPPPTLSLQPRIMLPRARGTARVELCVSCSTLPGGQSFEIGHHVFPIALDGQENIQVATQNSSFAPLPGVQAPTPLLDNFPASLPHPRLQGGWHSPAPSNWPQVMASRSVTPLYLGGSE